MNFENFFNPNQPIEPKKPEEERSVELENKSLIDEVKVEEAEEKKEKKHSLIYHRNKAEAEDDGEKPLIEYRRLNSIYKAAYGIKQSEKIVKENGEIKELKWQDLYKEIGDFESSIDLSEKIRQRTIEWVEKKIPSLQGEIKNISKLPPEKLSFAIASNWFSELPEVEGKRTETLISVMASVAKRIETRMWYKKLEEMNDTGLEKMGIDESERNLLVDLLKTGNKANPLFVRFLAYSRLFPEASKKADLQKFDVPGEKETKSLSQMFPKETGFLSKKFKQLYENSPKEAWVNKPGGEEMAEFLRLMSEIYSGNITAEQAQEMQEKIETASDQLIKSGFPIAVIPSVEGMYKEPHIDPEIKICLKSKDCQKQDEKFEKAKLAIVECLKKDKQNKFADNLEAKDTKSLIGVGEFGVNLAFKAVAQESKGTNVMFVNEQQKSYDANFPKYLSLITNSEKVFAGVKDEQKYEMSRMLAMLHEFSHLHIEKSAGSKRLGDEAEAVISETEAESVYRAYIPEIANGNGLDGTKEQWACCMLAGSLQFLKDPESYAKSAGFTLKKTLDEKAITWNGNSIIINNFEKLFEIQKNSLKEVLALYKDTKMTKEKANQWIDKNCSDKTIDEIIEFVGKQP